MRYRRAEPYDQQIYSVSVYDTTLRDGAQQQSVSFTVADKLAVARLLDGLGVAYIEGGWPGAVPKDTEFFARARDELDLTTSRLAAFGSTCRAGAAAEHDEQVRALVDSGAPVVTIVAKSDPLHVERALRTAAAENLRMVRDTVGLLVAAGRETMVDLEHFFDGLSRDPRYGIEVGTVFRELPRMLSRRGMASAIVVRMLMLVVIAVDRKSVV